MDTSEELKKIDAITWALDCFETILGPEDTSGENQATYHIYAQVIDVARARLARVYETGDTLSEMTFLAACSRLPGDVNAMMHARVDYRAARGL